MNSKGGNMFGKTAFLVLVILTISASTCTRDFSVGSPPNQKRDLKPFEKRLLNAVNDFGIGLFKETAKSEKEKNIFLSPFSVSAALGMTLNGADGQTEVDMANVLGFSGMKQTDINETYQNVIEWLTLADPKVDLDIANSIWYRSGFAVEPSFIQVNRIFFNALVRGLDFNLPSAPDTINGWIEINTGGKIRELIKQIKPTDVMFLINAIYFKAMWTMQFDKSQTREERFTLWDGSPVSCPMMRQRDSLLYLSTADFQAVDLPYSDGLFDMLIFLPKEGKTVDSFIQGITPETWGDWTARLVKTEITLILPKFKTEYNVLLNDVLKAMGMGVAFSPEQADFTRINRERNLYIDRVLHKAFIEVNEEGTEAAAATVVVIGRTSIGGPEEIMVFVNRPFVFAIRESQTGAIVFMGKMANPEQP